jgi:excisionase family DNA binding protein
VNQAALDKIREILTSSDILNALRKEFDRAFSVQVTEVDGKIRLQFIETDSSLEFMTVGDVSALLQLDRTTVRQMCESRARARTDDPLPVIRIGKSLRFKRSDVLAWIDRRKDVVIPPLPFGKQKKARLNVPLPR